MDTILICSEKAFRDYAFSEDVHLVLADKVADRSLQEVHTDIKDFERLSEVIPEGSGLHKALSDQLAAEVYLDAQDYCELLQKNPELFLNYTAVHKVGWVKLRQVPRTKRVGNKLLSVVVPIYFEEELIDELTDRMVAAMGNLPSHFDYEIIYVNDGSTDMSLPKMRQHAEKYPQIKIIDLSRNFGHQLAITAGMDAAKGDAVVVIDGDLQDPPEVILEMVQKWGEGYQVVYGLRKSREGETIFKLWTARTFYKILHKIAEVKIPQNVGDFRLMDRKVLQNLNSLREQNRYIRGMVSWLGFKTYPLEYQRDARYAGETKFSLTKMLKFALDGITSFSDKPLYLSGYLGLGMSLAGLVYSFLVVLSWISGDETMVPGWASVIIAVLLTGGVQLICLSVIGQYIGRIYKESKRRPLYAVNEKINF